MNFTSHTPNIGKQSARWFESAPPPFRQSLMASTMILVPALLGAAFEWPRYLTYALLVLGFSLEIAFGWAAARARGAEYRKARPSRGVMALVGGFSGLLGALVAGLHTTYTPLLFALSLIVVAEPWSRVVWKRQANSAE
jgi:hypothetical protein